MSQASPARKIDQTGLKTGQAVTILLLLAAFVLNSPLLVALVAVCQFLGALDLSFAPYRLLYKGLLVPAGLLKPRIETDNPEPHRFAMLIGAIFNGSAVLFLALSLPVVAWVLVWVVIALANLNFWLNFCLGCWMYYQLHRLGIPGFTAAPLAE
ncbi:MAG TPA: DUF4395 domain-containing protein [Candidatus Limnocylindrales bacterium]|nr:DUF4395 domain-containing protein [Candidatus Limnocylindrales bacterium]